MPVRPEHGCARISFSMSQNLKSPLPWIFTFEPNTKSEASLSLIHPFSRFIRFYGNGLPHRDPPKDRPAVSTQGPPVKDKPGPWHQRQTDQTRIPCEFLTWADIVAKG